MSAQVGPILVIGMEQCENTPTPSVLSHSSPESITELFVSLSAPPATPFMILGDSGFAGSSLLEGDGTMLFKSFAACSSDMVRVVDVPRMHTHCAMSH